MKLATTNNYRKEEERLLSKLLQEQPGASFSTEVSLETVYHQMYEEMRYYRTYELNTAIWHTTILAAILGVLLTVNLSTLPLQQNYVTHFTTKLFITLLITSIAASGVYTVNYAHLRLKQLRDYTNKNLEPSWKKFQPRRIRPLPRLLNMLNIAILVIAAYFSIWLLW